MPKEISKAAQVAIASSVTFEVIAKQYFPGESTPNAIVKFLASPAGRERYTEYLRVLADAGVR